MEEKVKEIWSHLKTEKAYYSSTGGKTSPKTAENETETSYGERWTAEEIVVRSEPW